MPSIYLGVAYHASFTGLLAGCQTVICGGIGQGAVNALASKGVESIVLAKPMNIEDAVAGRRRTRVHFGTAEPMIDDSRARRRSSRPSGFAT